MRLSITIETLNDRLDLALDDESNKAQCNGKKLNCDITELKLNILALIRMWPEKLVNTNIVDGIKYKVIYKNGQTKKTYIGINKLPYNFEKFHTLIKNVQ